MHNAQNFGKPKYVEICNVCNVELLCESASKEHYNGKLHHSTVERLEKRQKSAEYGIFIRRPDLSQVPDEELLQLFCQFGQILQIKRPPAERKFCILKFSESSAAQEALKTPILLRGHKLPVFPEKAYGTSYQMKMTTQTERFSPLENNPNDSFMNGKIISSTKNTELISAAELSELSGTFDEIVAEFVKKIEAERGLESKCEKVCRDLEKTFNDELPGVKARLFGSTITGLAFKESDLDIFMECPDEQPSIDFVAQNEHLMIEQGNVYTNLVTVSHARAPIYKFTHFETGLLCDVAFNDAIGIYHTDLIRFLLKFDKRVRLLFMIIKYWGFYHGITNSGNMPNFALIMMVIFYLQILKDQILPPIKYLQDLVKEEKVYVNGWDCSFCKDLRRIPKNKNKLKLQSLLYGFFDYYSRFNYKKHIVCPYLGKLVDKNDFLEQSNNSAFRETLPVDFKTCKENYNRSPEATKSSLDLNSLCVQDPFNQAFNITRCTSERHIVRFFWLCGYNCEFIFKKNPINIIKELYSPVAIDEPKRLVLNEKCSKDLYIQSIPLATDSCPQENYELFTEEYKVKWFKYLKESILLIFEDVFKFKISGNTKSNTINNVNELFSHLSFDCEGLCPIYIDRRKIRKILRLQNSDCIKSEIRISNYIMDNYKDIWCYMNAHFNMAFCMDNESPRVSMTMIDTTVSKFNTFADFSKYINTYIEDHCLQAFKHIAFNGFSKLPPFEASRLRSALGSLPSGNVRPEQKLSSASSVSSTDTSSKTEIRRKKKRK